MTLQRTLWGWLLFGALLGASTTATGAPPPASYPATGAAQMRAQLKDVDAKIAAARARNEALQSQVAHMEQQNAAQQKQLQQRDAEIAALQQKLHAPGAPASGASAGH